MLDIVPEDDQQNELTPHVEENETTDTKGGEILKDNDVRHALKRMRFQYYDKQQQLELVLAAQELFEFGEDNLILQTLKRSVGRTPRTMTSRRT
jgi:hypothetical protein